MKSLSINIPQVDLTGKNYQKILLILIVSVCMSACNSTETKKPNILFIAIDDLRPELACYGASHIQSPNIDALAKEGVLFEQAYVQQAVCMASRASLLTGLIPERRGLYVGNEVGKTTPDVLTLNKFFHQNGYDVSSFGKIYHYQSDHEEQFNGNHVDPLEKWAGRGYLKEESIQQIELNKIISQPYKSEKSWGGKGPMFEWADVPDSAYIDGYNVERAVEQLQRQKDSEQPFFMAFGFHKPHLPFVAPKKYWDMYPLETIELSEITEPPLNSHKYTLGNYAELRSYYGIPKGSMEVSADTARILRQAYFACVTYVDALIGKLIDELKAQDLYDNTVIVLWSDHGYKLGDYSNWGKWSNMHLDTHIPLIISGPGIEKNSRSSALVETLDLYPTLAALTGLEAPDHLDGESQVPLLKNPNLEGKPYIYTIWPNSRNNYKKTIMGYSVKSAKYNYVEWVKLATGEVLAKELYDHSTDPLETENVVENESYQEVITELTALLTERKKLTDHDHPFVTN